MVVIRKFQKKDAHELSGLITNTVRISNSADYSKEIIDKMCAFFSPEKLTELSAERSIFVALDGSKIVGTASLKENYILSVFVDANRQGKGIGTKLMKRVEEEVYKNGYKTVKLPSSITSVKFYTKLGYQKIEEVVREFGKNIIMTKNLGNGKFNIT